MKKTANKDKKKTVKKTKTSSKTIQNKKEKYFESIGRRKTAVARVRLFVEAKKKLLPKSKDSSSSASLQEISVNKKTLKDYFPIKELQQTVLSPLVLMNCLEQFKVSVKVKGGGIVSQSEALRHGISRALVLFNPDSRKKLKKAGYLKRDQRMRERKKFGLKRARRAAQWRKR